MIMVPLTQGKFAIVDNRDFDLVSQYSWYTHLSRNTYYARTDTPVKIAMHQLILSSDDPELEIDHINRKGFDNRRSNLRLVTHARNLRNQKKRSGCTSRFLGVYCNCNTGKWESYIKYKGKKLHLGHFQTELEAAEKRALMEEALDAREDEVFGLCSSAL